MAVTPPMNPEIKALWVQWLRDNADKQGREALRTPEGTFCCLGGLCELAVAAGVVQRMGDGYGTAEGTLEVSTLPQKVSEWAGLTGYTPDNPTVKVRRPDTGFEVEDTLVELNDSWDGYDFNKIADVIEAQL